MADDTLLTDDTPATEDEVRPAIAGSRSRRPAAEVAPPNGPGGVLAYAWAVLTSMRTAIILLLLLALVSIPGGILPQRPQNAFAVTQWKGEHPAWAGPFEWLRLFDVFHAPWFAAVYLLLFVSLVGCIVPRTLVYLKAMRQPPASPPRALTKLSGLVRYALVGEPEDTLAAARRELAKRRFRVRTSGDTVCAERGYLREAGNLAFHIAVLGVLVSIAAGGLFGYTGTAAVVEGQGFSNTLTQYDDMSAGAAFSPKSLTPFTLSLDTFHVRYETGPVQRGAAREFAADVVVTDAKGTRTAVIQVNQPLVEGGTQVSLVGHGYAPVVTVRDGHGDVAFSGPVVFVPIDGNLTSAGVIQGLDARPDRLGFEGYFLPTGTVDQTGPHSTFPEALNPELFLNAWSGPPATETGQPQSVYTLDKTGMTQLSDNGEPLRIRLSPGEMYVLPGAQGTLSFDGWQRWIKLQYSTSPGIPWALGFVLLAVLGMAVSLAVKPRRIWAAVERGETHSTLLLAGQDRADGRVGVQTDLDAVAKTCGAQPERSDE